MQCNGGGVLADVVDKKFDSCMPDVFEYYWKVEKSNIALRNERRYIMGFSKDASEDQMWLVYSKIERSHWFISILQDNQKIIHVSGGLAVK